MHPALFFPGRLTPGRCLPKLVAVNENQQLLAELMTAQEAGEPVVLATIVRVRGSVPRHVGTKMLVYEDGRFSGTVGGGEIESQVLAEAQVALADGRPRLLPYTVAEAEQGGKDAQGAEIEIFLEPYLPAATLLVIGCGHVGRAVAGLAHWLGYRVAVSDDREELATPENIPEADVYLPGRVEETLRHFHITRNTYIVLATRNVLVDQQIVPHLVHSPAPYIGLLGSERRWAETIRLLREDGLSDEQLARLHSPVGLELNAETPEEIAVSILAEIIMLRRGGTGERMAAV